MTGMDHESLYGLPEREVMIYDRQKQFLVNNTAGNQKDHGIFCFFVDCLFKCTENILFFASRPLVNEAYSTKCTFNHFRITGFRSN